MKSLMNLMISKKKKKAMDPTTTSWLISGLGLAVSVLGTKLLKKKFGAGILGFGLAHVLLGQLDRLRPIVREH
ncbi:MAG: hypothetical protein PWR10_361 [Halanaerobiales bacterium]|nr:hypothetical protein [Halanaerobiales bacterium]